jgi:hypothetical protein
MPIVVPGRDYTQSWNALADVFGNYAQTREDAYQRQRQRASDARAAAYHAQRMRNIGLDITEKERIAGNILSDEELAAQMGIAFAPSSVPTTPSNFGQYPGEGGREPPTVTTGFAPTEDARNLARVKMGRGMTPDAALVIQRMQNYAHSLEQRKEQALAAGDVHRTRLLDEEIKTIQRDIDVATKQSTIDYAGTQAEASASRAETAALAARQNRKWYESVGIATGDIRKPGMIPHTRSDTPGYTVDPRSYRPDDPEWKQAEKYYTAYGPKSQADFATIADVASGRRNWDTSLDKSGYTVAQTNTLADTFAPQFETQFDDSDQVSKREAEKMASYALAAAKQIFNNPDIPLPPGTTALDLYNQILNQRDLYSVDGGIWPNDNYEPITEVATIIENWQNLNKTERPPGDQGQATNNVTFTGINKQTGKQVTVTQEELIAAARERYPHMSIEVAIAKVKQDLGIQ